MSNIFPSAFIRSLDERFQLQETGFFSELAGGRPVTSVRLNPFKPVSVFDTQERVPWCEYGRYLPERPSFIADPLFHAGCYYVQEASSMFLYHIMTVIADRNNPLTVLDLCAAPGGKSTLLASVLSPESLLVSNEIIKSRVPVLTDNMNRWGILNSVVTNNDPKAFDCLSGFFDILLVDAPCSGSGMFRKDPQAIGEWSENAVQLCSQRQKRILADSYRSLKKDGLLIYSTCSFSAEENEEIADWLCDEFELEPVRIPLNETWGVTETQSGKHLCYGYRFYPHLVEGEGFFVCCFRKKDGGTVPVIRSRVQTGDRKSADIVKSWLNNRDEYTFLPFGDGINVINSRQQHNTAYLQKHLNVRKAGVAAGRIVGNGLLPDQQLAQSLILSDKISRISLNTEEAIGYLRKDELRLNTTLKGWVLMCFEGYGLGWAKILPNRINNYYPKEMRILKEISF